MNKNKNARPEILKKYIANVVGEESISTQTENNSNKHIANAVGAHDCTHNTKNVVNAVGLAAHSDPHSRGITLIALIITMVLHYYYCIKYSNSNGFLKAIV